MQFFLFLLLLSMLLAVAVVSEEIDVDSDGTLLDKWSTPRRKVAQSAGRNVIVVNSFPDRSIGLYWEDPNSEDEFKMFDIAANGSANLNTFNGHTFYAKEDGKSARLPDSINIRENSAYYSIGPAETKSYRFSVADGISTQFGHHGSRGEVEQAAVKSALSHIKVIGARTTALSAKFRCHLASVDYYYDNGAEGTFQGSLTMGKETTINTYEGHVFFFTKKGDKSVEFARYQMRKEQSLYIIEDENSPPPANIMDLTAKEKEFHEVYFNQTGMLWRHYYGLEGPRPPPILHMWSASEIGERHQVTSDQGFWECSGSAATCQSTQPVQLELVVASLEPRAFIIPKFLSDFETDEIIKIARPQIKNSFVGNSDGGGARESDTRTSRNAWVQRSNSPVTETLYVRAAHLLNLDEKLLQTHTNAEDIQVVHYVNGQKYDSHHDWGVSGYPESRFITLLLYLTDQEDPEAGGETAFPKGADGLGFKVSPVKGSAVLFYNLLEDGNGDDLALHAALPVHRGEKWLANFWVWDPKRK